MQQSHVIWTSAMRLLGRRVDHDTFERYFADVLPIAFNDEAATLTLGTSNDLVALWLSSNYRDLILDALCEATGRPLDFHVESGHTAAQPVNGKALIPQTPDKPAPATVAERAAAPTATAESEHKYRPDFTFETFVVGNSNKICVAAAQAVSEKPGRAYNPLLIYGGVALGKTHLLQAIANDIGGRRKRAKIEYLTSEEFVNLYVEALQAKRLASFRRHFRSLDVLLIDDIQFFEGKVGSSEEFFHTFNTLHNSHKQIVLASDRMPQEIAGLEQRLVSRFEWGLSAQILAPDWETRLAILKKKQERQDIKLSDDVLKLIARKITSNIRNLESALTRLIMNMSAFGTEMSVQEAERLLQDKFDQEKTRVITMEVIQRRVGEHFDISRSDMLSKKRPREIARARMVAMYLSRRLTGHSLPAIGEAFDRNHATVLHAVDQVEKLMKDDDQFRYDVELLTRQLTS